MERTFKDVEDDFVIFGVASLETKGAIGGVDDNVGLLQQTGLSPD